MTADINTIARTPNEAVVSVSGRLSRDTLPILDGEIRRILVDAERVVVDLKRVPSIDNHALASLRRWVQFHRSDSPKPRVQLTLRDGSRFVRVQLASRGLVSD